MSQKVASTLKRRPGRPRKFAGASRALTVTLPESVFEILRGVDPDISRAIVRIAERRVPEPSRPATELMVFGKRAVITVRPTPTLERRTGVSLVPLPDGRALISFDEPTTVEELELLLYDAIDDAHLTPEDAGCSRRSGRSSRTPAARATSRCRAAASSCSNRRGRCGR